jgi:hypothetical protein
MTDMTGMKRISLAAAVAALSLGTAATGRAQTYEHHPPVTVGAAVNNMSHLRTGDPADQDKRMFLFRRSPGGIRWKVWQGTSDAVGSWSAWTTRTDSSVAAEGPLGTSIAPVGGETFSSTYGIYLPRFHAFFDFTTSSGESRLGKPEWTWLNTSYRFDALTVPASGSQRGFQPWSSIAWRVGGAVRYNVFGLKANVQAGTWPIIWSTGLREACFDGTSWSISEHGAPSGVSYLRLGPQCAAWTNPTGWGRGYVFASADDGNLYCRAYAPGGSWTWVNLGRPERTLDMRTPLAVAYGSPGASSVNNGKRVAVFVVCNTETGYRLFGRYSDSGTSFSAWHSYGAPALTPNGGDQGFDMTGGAVWYAGSTLRINLFGTTDKVDRLSSGLGTHEGGRLVEYFWDGATWRWGQNLTIDEESWYTYFGGGGFHKTRVQTMNVAVVETQSWERISVFCEDEYGRTWERAWTGSTWVWIQH